MEPQQGEFALELSLELAPLPADRFHAEIRLRGICRMQGGPEYLCVGARLLHLDFVDKSGGFKRDHRILPKEMSQTTLKLYGVGGALYVIGYRGPRSLMEIMETVR